MLVSAIRVMLVLLLVAATLTGCTSASDSRAPDTSRTLPTTTTTVAPPTTAPTTTEVTLPLVEQQQRYDQAHRMGNCGVMVDLVDYRPEAWASWPDVIVVRGTVVAVRPLLECIYGAFYLDPSEILRSAASLEEPIPFVMFTGGSYRPQVGAGDQLLVIAHWEQPASTVSGYVPIGYAWGVFMRVGDEYLSIMDPSLLTTPDELRQVLSTVD